jgi:hypothetical protein
MFYNKFVRMKAFYFFFFTAIYLISVSCNPKTQNTSDINPALITAAEDLNHVLPQRQGIDLYLDSVSVEAGRMTYYYSHSGLTLEQFNKDSMGDSLYTAAVDRIPCSLWRPGYMQSVDVTFRYFSSDGEELFQFTESQASCN